MGKGRDDNERAYVVEEATVVSKGLCKEA